MEYTEQQLKNIATSEELTKKLADEVLTWLKITFDSQSILPRILAPLTHPKQQCWENQGAEFTINLAPADPSVGTMVEQLITAFESLIVVGERKALERLRRKDRTLTEAVFSHQLMHDLIALSTAPHSVLLPKPQFLIGSQFWGDLVGSRDSNSHTTVESDYSKVLQGRLGSYDGADIHSDCHRHPEHRVLAHNEALFVTDTYRTGVYSAAFSVETLAPGLFELKSEIGWEVDSHQAMFITLA